MTGAKSKMIVHIHTTSIPISFLAMRLVDLLILKPTEDSNSQIPCGVTVRSFAKLLAPLLDLRLDLTSIENLTFPAFFVSI